MKKRSEYGIIIEREVAVCGFLKSKERGAIIVKREWTKEQLSAINTRDKTLLVSAAAGSGKTATLTERIIRSLLDEKNPENIDSLLVVTFTVSAAAELRAKISKALSEAVAANPGNKHLERQLYMLPSAKICTIDSFCNDVLKNNTDKVGIAPNYRLADSAECGLLATSVLEGLIEAVYEGELPEISTPEDFEALADCLTDSKRTEELSETFRYVYEKCESTEAGVDSLIPLIDVYKDGNSPVEETVYGRYLMSSVRETLLHYEGALSAYEREFSAGGGVAEDKYLGNVIDDLALVRRLLACRSYEDFRAAIFDSSLTRLASVKAVDHTESTKNYNTMRKLMKAEIIEDMPPYFRFSSENWRDLYETLYKLFGVFYRFLKRFDELYLAEKCRRGMFSFADIERFAYKCLLEDGAPTDVAKSLSEKYSAVYIDEYQDVNSLQDKIFEAVSRPENRFMVGDIKQSIYCFRSARPEIFAEMKNKFPPIGEAKGNVATLFMSSNFRCDKAIVDFVNGIFDNVFSLVGESIGYSSGDRLTYAKLQEHGEPEYIAPEICMLDKPDGEGQGLVNEAELVAIKIDELLANARLNNGEPVEPKDIAIILRTAKNRATRFVEALERRGISACISGDKDFFLSSEVLLALCLLNSIDNPRRDIYLAGLMCSPLFSFTPDDLYHIKEKRQDTLYESLVEYTEENPEFLKGRVFLERLDYYRTISEGIGVDRLLFKLYHETGLLSLASKNGGKENLTVLYDYARQFEGNGFRGLYSFINFVNSLIDKKTTFDDARAGSGGNSVNIITCHASKGLEYPIVFIASASDRITNKDSSQRLVFSSDFGIAMRLRTPSGLAIVKNPVVDLINQRIFAKQFEEELRILYVALTRARERLFIIGTSPRKKREEYEDLIRMHRQTLGRHSLLSLSSFLEIILSTTDGAGAKDSVEFADFYSACEYDITPTEEQVTLPDVIDEDLRDELISRFKFEYPDRYLTELPEKMSVSKTTPTVLDGTDAESVSIGEKRRRIGVAPAFLSGEANDESALRGIATHYFLQFCDLENFARVGAKEELSRLTSSGFISETDAQRVRINEIEAFGRSSLFDEMRCARELYREFRFNVRLPANIFTSEEQRKAAYNGRDVLVQGVIDCIIVREDGSIGLYDYKTDRLPKDALSDRALAEVILKEKHKTQLSVYALAVEKVFGRYPSSVGVYSLPLGDTVSVI